ncbi:AAA family ATPase [uncultured Holdemanella sp.]|uniref:AAA family ATPase n=1 Tax=uncultured Holdemanella sp. TaxID=1763549 RepID=UPI0025E6B762|nr:AAA family ATPase [uncultured Holdemanella sp.]
MDISVKQSLTKLLLACSKEQELIDQDGGHLNVKQVILNNIAGFIEIISLDHADLRIDSFNKEFFGSKEKMNVVSIHSWFSDFQTLNLMPITKALYAQFVYELGRYYLFNKNDKKDIVKDHFIQYIKLLDIKQEEKTIVVEEPKEESSESLEDLQKQLDSMIGLDEVKEQVHSIINELKIDELRKSKGLKVFNTSKHLVFKGNPGTGKTTIARLLSKIYRELGILEKGQLIEVDRGGIVAGYVGQTALKTKEKIDEAMGGILFIDEAYTLAKGENDFGQEAIDTLLKAMEDHRDEFIVIVAGYDEPMEAFLQSNPGLKSRFNEYIHFDDYSEEELFTIFGLLCEQNDFRMDLEAQETLKTYLNDLCIHKPDNFANGREMRNLFDKSKSAHANRLASLNEISDEDLITFKKDDLLKAIEEMKSV